MKSVTNYIICSLHNLQIQPETYHWSGAGSVPIGCSKALIVDGKIAWIQNRDTRLFTQCPEFAWLKAMFFLL